ncbi:hypothetical protein ACQRET_03565 [Streptomyces koyangensis]|uniref:hypothetical protein n=1 Tax=Streptomyces koyangensis TaxID=188770 RepID=UPI003CFC26C0
MEEPDAEEVRRLKEAIGALAAIKDDEACAKAISVVLEDWPDLHADLRKLRQERVQRLKQSGLTWKQVGALLGRDGVTAARAQQIATGLRGAKRPPKKAGEPPSAE